MASNEFKYGRNSTYKLVSVKDHQCNDKAEGNPFYEERVGCVATDFYYDNYPSKNGSYRLNMKFVRNKEGKWANRGLHTSVVLELKGTENGFELVTAYSVYRFERVQINDITSNNNKSVIELFLSHEDDYKFAKGFYYDSEGKTHELTRNIHLGMFTDSVLVRFDSNEDFNDYVCRYFPKEQGVEFYNTIYMQQDYSTPILIHNTGHTPFEVKFERFPHKWTIMPGDSKQIVPFDSEGADVE